LDYVGEHVANGRAKQGKDDNHKDCKSYQHANCSSCDHPSKSHSIPTLSATAFFYLPPGYQASDEGCNPKKYPNSIAKSHRGGYNAQNQASNRQSISLASLLEWGI